MGEVTKISWTGTLLPNGSLSPGATFNPWWGCQQVSQACDRCYAMTFAHRLGIGWGTESRRRFFGEKHWAQPLAWERKARESGARRKVFCASMADVFELLPRDHPDREQMERERLRLWTLIGQTPHLTWLLLTKRPGSIPHMVPPAWMAGSWPENVWAGTTTETQEWLEKRGPLVARLPAPVRFLSVEPMLGPLNMTIPADGEPTPEGHRPVAYDLLRRELLTNWQYGYPGTMSINWILVGSESGHGARPCDLDWVRDLRDQCQRAGTAFHWKQHIINGVVLHTPELDGRRWTQFPDEARGEKLAAAGRVGE